MIPMIFLYFLFTFIYIPTLSADEGIASETAAHEILIKEVAKNYSDAFLQGVERYNKNRKELPRMTLNQKGEARVDFASEVYLRLSADSLLQGVVFLNDKKLEVKQITQESIERLLKERSQIQTLIDFIVPSAFARRDFEELVFKTVVGIKDNFEDFSCWLDKCKVEQFKHNFEKVMGEIKKKARACEKNANSEEVKDFAYKLRDQLEYQSSQWYFEQNLKKYFNGMGPQGVSCQKFVESAFKSELEELSKNNVFSRYLENTSVDAYEGRTPSEKRYNAFISQQCQPYVELRNCLVGQRRGDAVQIFNKMREQGKEVPIKKKYEPTPSSGARKQ